MKKLTNTPHDHNFRLSLSNKEVAKDFLKTHLPTTIFKKINLRTLTICSNSYITPELEGSYSDILYKTTTTKSSYCYIYLLIEHMSTSSWDIPIRMLQYQLAVIDTHRRQHPKDKKLPIVVPLLFYNGKKSPYPHNLDIIKLFNDQILAKNTFARPAGLIDLTRMTDQEIKKHNIISLLEFAQKHVRDQKLLKNTVKTLAHIINRLVNYIGKNKSIEIGNWLKDYINGNLHYLYYFAKIDNDKEFTEELEKVDFIKEEDIMGALARKIEQQGIEKGIEQGIEQGIEKGIRKTALSMTKKGLDISLICEVTNLSAEEVNKLKEAE